MMRVDALMARVTDECARVLNNNLLAVYLHGSSVLGGFRWEVSDLDFLVITDHEPTLFQKCEWIDVLLKLWPSAPPKGFEMSVLVRDELFHFTHPTPFCLHLSSMHMPDARRDPVRYCTHMHGKDADLAAHLTVTRAYGRALYGPPPDCLLPEVPPEDYLDSIMRDISNACDDVRDHPVYIVLNLCRVYGYIMTGRVMSKAQGGTWGIAQMPEYAQLISDALNAYTRLSPVKSSVPERIAFCRDVCTRFEGVRL